MNLSFYQIIYFILLKEYLEKNTQSCHWYQRWKKWIVQPRQDLEETTKQQVTLGKRAETCEITLIAQELCKVSFALKANPCFLDLGRMHGLSEGRIFHQKKCSQHFQKETYEEPKWQGRRHVLAWGAMPPNPSTPAKALETLLYYYMKTSWVPVIVTIGPPNIHSIVHYQFLWISLFPLLYLPKIQLEKVSF